MTCPSVCAITRGSLRSEKDQGNIDIYREIHSFLRPKGIPTYYTLPFVVVRNAVLQKRLSWACFVVIKPRLLLDNRVDFGLLFCFINFPISPPLPRFSPQMLRAITPFLCLEIRRKHILTDSIKQLACLSSDFHKPLKFALFMHLIHHPLLFFW